MNPGPEHVAGLRLALELLREWRMLEQIEYSEFVRRTGTKFPEKVRMYQPDINTLRAVEDALRERITSKLTPPPPPGPTVTVRVAVAVDVDGYWEARGWLHGSDSNISKEAARLTGSPGASIRYLTARVPIPRAVEIEAEVEL